MDSSDHLAAILSPMPANAIRPISSSLVDSFPPKHNPSTPALLAFFGIDMNSLADASGMQVIAGNSSCGLDNTILKPRETK